MRFFYAFDGDGNASIHVSDDDKEYLDGMVGANALTGRKSVPMNPLQGSQLETITTMEDNIEELMQLMIQGDMFPTFAENASYVLLTEAIYTKVDAKNGKLTLKYMTPFTAGVSETVIDISSE